MKVNLYDFDNTIYKGDSSTDFFFYSLMCYPKIIKYVPSCIMAACKYKIKLITKTEMKETFFVFLESIDDIDKHIISFWNSHSCYIKEFYMKKDHSKDIIISASPEFLLKPITDELQVLDLIGSKVNKNTGKFTGLNCHGKEKVKRLNKRYKDLEVMRSYSDSKSDIPILKLAKKAYYVKGNKVRRIEF